MRFFFDNCVPPALARAVHELASRDHHEVVSLRDHPKLEPSTPDPEWLNVLGEEGNWTIVSGDVRISTNRHQRQVWLSTGLTAFFLANGWTNRGLWDIAWMFVRWWPQIVKQAGLVDPGAGFIIPNKSTGKFKQIQPRVS